MPEIDTAEVDKWARFALTGDPDSATPTAAALAFVRPAAIHGFLAANPCVADSDNPATHTILTDAADVSALEEAVGYEVASLYLGTRAGHQLFGNSQERVGPVSITRSQAVSPGAMKQEFRMAASMARRRISCIREAIAEANTGRDNPGFFGLAGYRRTVGSAGSVQGAILGAGEDGTVEL